MTSAQFIDRWFGVDDGKSRFLSSIYKDEKGNIYSYGSHYPLLFKVKNLTFRNIRGYSNTTAKHINWAGGFGAIDVELSGCNQYSWRNGDQAARVPALLYSQVHYGYEGDDNMLAAIKSDLRASIDRLQTELDGKKRKDTAIYASLEQRRDFFAGNLARVEAA